MTHTLSLDRHIYLAVKAAYIEAISEGRAFSFYTPLEYL